MPVKKGTKGLIACYKGTTGIAKIYKGTTLMFQKPSANSVYVITSSGAITRYLINKSEILSTGVISKV